MILHCETSKQKQGSVKTISKKQAIKNICFERENIEKWGWGRGGPRRNDFEEKIRKKTIENIKN